ncbi:hypothetical protein PPROV_000491000 [Pycnococcus provasolii]|uniref:WGR domain-containing protein n=1 Tax=Pycnococcus provasolii TaxID=41880 RepID=A0A830HHW8_9CHLO|nr:hypothetical protein PPROV_000491000 [Pycnococcus provasolii]
MPQPFVPFGLGPPHPAVSIAYLTHPETNNYYEVQRFTRWVICRWGAQGHFGQANEKCKPNEPEAVAYADDNIRRMRAKGFVDAPCPDAPPAERGGSISEASTASMLKTFKDNDDHWYEVQVNGRTVRTSWGTVSSGNDHGTIRCWLFPTEQAALNKAEFWCRKRVNPTYYQGYVEVSAGERDDE